MVGFGGRYADAISVAASLRIARRLARCVLPDANPGGTVYGLIAIGALLAAESSLRETYAETIGSVALTMLLYWCAHAYAEILGARLSTQHRLGWRRLRGILLHDWAIVRGASLPFVCLLIAWAAGAPQRSAVTAGLWTAIGSLIAFELAAGVRADAKRGELALDALAGMAMGLAILGVKALLH